MLEHHHLNNPQYRPAEHLPAQKGVVQPVLPQQPYLASAHREALKVRCHDPVLAVQQHEHLQRAGSDLGYGHYKVSRTYRGSIISRQQVCQ